MRPLPRVFLLPLLSLGLLLAACRDEQAGPRPRTSGASAQIKTLGAAPADLTFRSGASLGGGALVYLGSKVFPPQPSPGQAVQLSHYFQAVRPPPEGFSFFVHMVDPGTGQMVANADHDIQNGAAPMASWPLGKVVEDIHTVQMPPLPVRVMLGFWRGDERLPVDDPRAQDGSNRLLGPELGIAPALPEYKVQRVSKPLVLDGVLDDAAWKDATPVVLRGSFDGRSASLRTEARMLYDEANLYVAFDVEDPDVWGTLLTRDAPIYEQEVVEVFLDANADGKTYNELQVSPHNVIFDAYFPARRQGMDLSWDSGMKTALKVRGTLDNPADRDEGWTVEMQIPFARLAEVPSVPPRKGDRWRFNLYRLEHLGRRGVEGQAFSPLFIGDFHALPRFGWLTFD
ncbi:carbohydrate-binding family 9-like protein [Stigmatella sp. ncwal1]|uniref:Carbohydrate-binding family 9-like protein n=1 Tax=Stigmatella ashevillensis TaxID=2995309 RepID=A0ABT5DN32_9BACT|nr:carbohydrate-binding family 9-like protein [Stigmatella ashevillena]MDC0715009.1 carbohydrate-binding family 9-like protein [Stigmatella ashevillena]